MTRFQSIAAILTVGVFAAFAAATLRPAAAADLSALDTRSDGTPLLNLIVHPEPLPAPEFRFFDKTGKAMTLANFRGRYTAVHFWATWCFPCRGELPTVDALQDAIGEEKLAILALSLDRHGPEHVAEFYDEFGIRHLGVYMDERMNAARILRVNGIPSTIFVDGEGREVARVLGDRDWSEPEVIELVRRMVE